jgi:hypothetical protein
MSDLQVRNAFGRAGHYNVPLFRSAGVSRARPSSRLRSVGISEAIS